MAHSPRILLLSRSFSSATHGKSPSEEVKARLRIRQTFVRVVRRSTHLGNDTASQERSVPLPLLPVFRIEIWDLEGTDGLWLDLIHETLFRVLDGVPSEQHREEWTHSYTNNETGRQTKAIPQTNDGPPLI